MKLARQHPTALECGVPFFVGLEADRPGHQDGIRFLVCSFA
jgi:hypothetical protein